MSARSESSTVPQMQPCCSQVQEDLLSPMYWETKVPGNEGVRISNVLWWYMLGGLTSFAEYESADCLLLDQAYHVS